MVSRNSLYDLFARDLIEHLALAQQSDNKANLSLIPALCGQHNPTPPDTSDHSYQQLYQNTGSVSDYAVQMRPQPLGPHGLHHSAENHTPLHSLDISLTYPSGGAEAFSFGPRLQKRTHKYSRPLDPLYDLVRTIELILHANSTLPPNLCHTISTTLRTFWSQRSNPATLVHHPLFRNIISNINIFTSHPPPSPFHPTPIFIEHFFDQLHDRCIADSSFHLERTSSQTREATYGEFRPSILSQIFAQTGLTAECTFLDLGSGVGQVVLQAALETGCKAYGIERENASHLLACFHFQQFQSRCGLYGLNHGAVVLKKGDFLKSRFVEDVLGCVDVVLVNNLKLEPQTDFLMQVLLGARLKSGARVVSTRPVERGRLKKRRKVEGREGRGEESFEIREFVYPEESVSWSGKTGVYYISTRL